MTQRVKMIFRALMPHHTDNSQEWFKSFHFDLYSFIYTIYRYMLAPLCNPDLSCFISGQKQTQLIQSTQMSSHMRSRDVAHFVDMALSLKQNLDQQLLTTY